MRGAVGGIDDGAADLGGETDGLLDVLHAEGRSVRAHQREGAVDLRHLQALGVEVLLEPAGIGLERDGRVVAQALHEVLAVDHAELDVRSVRT